MSTVTAGLRDVVAVSSAICTVNGTEGKLIYAGYDIADLAEHASFEEVVYLLWHGRLPTREQFTGLKSALEAEAALPGPMLALLGSFPSDATPMNVLRTAVSALAIYDP